MIKKLFPLPGVLWLVGLLALTIWLASILRDNVPTRRTSMQTVAVEELVRTATTTSGAPIVMPKGALEFVASTYRIGSRAVLPPHRHPYPRYAYVVSGSLDVTNLETRRSRLFNAGDVIVEDVGAWHEARNREAQPVRLLVFDLVKPATGNVEVRN